MFGSIALYSVANFATGFVQTVDQYAWARFIAGIGLAGELGAGITLVSELLPKDKRGVGTSLVAGVGLFGAVFAYFVYKFTNDWRLCYMIGGGLGIGLLLLRITNSLLPVPSLNSVLAGPVPTDNSFQLIHRRIGTKRRHRKGQLRQHRLQL